MNTVSVGWFKDYFGFMPNLGELIFDGKDFWRVLSISECEVTLQTQ